MKNYYLTDEQFDAFLQSIGGLENGFYTNRPTITSRGICSCGNGWLGLIKKLIEKCMVAGWDKQICQIKEKFGGLRFYINGATKNVWRLIGAAEKMSYSICEHCGSTEHVGSTTKGWIYTCCKKCAERQEFTDWVENHKGNDGIISINVRYPV